MPRFNEFAEVVAGNGAQVSINKKNVPGPGTCQTTCSDWLNNNEIIYQANHSGLWTIDKYSKLTNQVETISPIGCNAMAVGGGSFVAWLDHFGMYGGIVGDYHFSPVGTDGRAPMGQDGTICYTTDKQDPYQYILGDHILNSAPYGLYILNKDAAIWDTGSIGFPTPKLLQGARGIIPIQTNDGLWWIYWTDAQGLVAHRDDSFIGYQIEARPRAFHHDAVFAKDGRLYSTYSTGVQELPEEIEIVDIWNLQEIDLRTIQAPPDPIVAIGRPLWLGWFEFADPPMPAPGNCTLRTPELVVRSSGGALAQYIAAEAQGNTPEAYRAEIAKARERHPTLPIIAYWPKAVQSGYVPECEWVGVEAYRRVGESLLAFEQQLRIAIKRCYRAAIIAQCYTSNSTLTSDLASLVPIYARVARECTNVTGIFVFSDYGRPTGLQDHPEVRPLWQTLSEGITRMPPIIYLKSPIVLPPPPPPPPPPPQPTDEDKDMPVISDEEFQKYVDAAYELGKKYGLKGFENEELAKHSIRSGIGDKFRKPKSQGGPEKNPTVWDLIVGATYRFGTPEVKDEILAQLVPEAIAETERLRR